MWSIHYYQPQSPVFLHPQLKHNGRFGRDKVFFFPSTIDRRRPSCHFTKPFRIRLKILKASVVPPAESGDVTSFLQISGGLIFLYWIANFVVPYLISKYFGFDKVNQERDSDN